MKFYIAEEADGRQVITSSQDKARAINTNFNDFEVPVDKAGLMAFAQDALDNIHLLRGQLKETEAHLNEKILVPREPVITEEEPTTLLQDIIAVPVGKKLLQQTSWTATQIEDFILNHASVAQVENLFSCLGNRFAELAKGTGL